MGDPNRKTYKKVYMDEFKIASNFLINRYDGELKWADADYEVFIYTTKDIRIIFYPYKASGALYHIRVRDGGSKNKKRAQAIMDILQIDMPPGKSFHQKNNHCCNWYSDSENKKQQIRKLALLSRLGGKYE